MEKVEIPKEFICFIAVLVLIGVLRATGHLAEPNFMKVLLLIIGGYLGWGVGYATAKVKS